MSVIGAYFRLARVGWVLMREGVVSALPADGMPPLASTGKAVAGDEESYRYLVESIRKFPNQENFAARIRRAGFGRVTYRT
jgi:ubiquinone/menaquinone biosynthesis C-methylase UbiE